MLTTMVAEPQTGTSPDSEVPEGSPDGLRELIAAYRNHTPPVTLGRMFVNFRNRHQLSQQKLSRLSKITPGIIHHHESLLTLPPELIAAVEDGRLKYKEARSISDIRLNGRFSGPDFGRQREIAKPFIDGTLSSLYAEPMVKLAKVHPDMPVHHLISMASVKVKEKHPKIHIAVPPPLRPDIPLPVELKTKMVELAAMLTKVQMRPYCETELLAVRSVARILLDRMKGAGVYGEP